MERKNAGIFKPILKRKNRDERSLNKFKVWTGPKAKTGANQDAVVKDVYKSYKDVGTLGGSIFTLGRRGVCMSYCAYYLVNRLADKGDFWSWLSEPNSKWAIISQYLGDGYRLLPADQMQNRLQQGILNQRFKLVDTQILVGDKCDAPNLAYAFISQKTKAQGVMCVLSGGEQPAHAIAAIRREGHILFMDPEMGERDYRSDQDLSWFLFEANYGVYAHAHINFYALR
jgi:hypothetical protein